jgi:hypothetical protein
MVIPKETLEVWAFDDNSPLATADVWFYLRFSAAKRGFVYFIGQSQVKERKRNLDYAVII